NTLTAPGTRIAAYEFSQPSLFISSHELGSSTCDGSIIVASMITASSRLPANSYFANANPPRLLSVTTSTVCAEARNSEFRSHDANPSRRNSTRKLSSVSELRCGQGRNVYANRSSPRLSDAH